MRPWEQFTNQQQWKEYLQNLLRTNKKALYRAIILIADKQTPEEKVWGATIEKNNEGFGAVDAELLTSLALRLKVGGELTERELAICRNKMPKYWRQLMMISKRRMNDERKANQENSGRPDKPGSGLGSSNQSSGIVDPLSGLGAPAQSGGYEGEQLSPPIGDPEEGARRTPNSCNPPT